MSKIVLIEDIPNRQKDFTNKLDCNLDKFEMLKNICGGSDFSKIKREFNSNDFSGLNNFDVVIIHRSSLTSTERLKLIEYIRLNSKSLVFFSGGISNISIQKLGSGDFLTINSKDLYSSNLVNYLNHRGDNLLELAFGKKWRLNLEINLLDRLVFYIPNYTSKPFQIVQSELKLNDWLIEKYFEGFRGKIDKAQLIDIFRKLKSNIITSIK